MSNEKNINTAGKKIQPKNSIKIIVFKSGTEFLKLVIRNTVRINEKIMRELLINILLIFLLLVWRNMSIVF